MLSEVEESKCSKIQVYENEWGGTRGEFALSKDFSNDINLHNKYNDKYYFFQVGAYDEMTGLSINSSMTRGYDDLGKQLTLSEIRSVCNDSDSCIRRSDTGAALIPFMKIPANQEFVIGVMMPVHQPGNSFFTCSRVVQESSLQNLFALSYALQKVNENSTILPEIQLGEFSS